MRKNRYFAAAFFFFFTLSFALAQEMSEEVRELMETGVEYHDEGEYDKAIEYYEQALKLAPDIPAIYYEIAFSHLYNENPQAALEYCRRGIDLAEAQDAEDILAGLYDLKGSALDDLGRHQEAVDVYLEALRRFDTGSTRLYYNLGLTYYRMGEKDKSREVLAQSLLEDTFHPSSNFLVGKICYEQGRKTQSLYSLCYFLLLEPNTRRSEEAYETIQQLVTPTENIGFSNTGMYTSLDLMLSLLFINDTYENLSAGQKFTKKLETFFRTVYETLAAEKNETAPDLWREFYIPFFSRLVNSEHFEAFCRYISLASSEEARDWAGENSGKMDALFAWLNKE